MKNPMVTRMLEKVVSLLCSKEGCTVSTTEETSESSRTIVEDVFGYRYSVTVTLLGRSQLWNSDHEVKEKLSRENLKQISEMT